MQPHLLLLLLTPLTLGQEEPGLSWQALHLSWLSPDLSHLLEPPILNVTIEPRTSVESGLQTLCSHSKCSCTPAKVHCSCSNATHELDLKHYEFALPAAAEEVRSLIMFELLFYFSVPSL